MTDCQVFFCFYSRVIIFQNIINSHNSIIHFTILCLIMNSIFCSNQLIRIQQETWIVSSLDFFGDIAARQFFLSSMIILVFLVNDIPFYQLSWNVMVLSMFFVGILELNFIRSDISCSGYFYYSLLFQCFLNLYVKPLLAVFLS